jgi:hypothetical protein
MVRSLSRAAHFTRPAGAAHAAFTGGSGGCGLERSATVRGGLTAPGSRTAGRGGRPGREFPRRATIIRLIASVMHSQPAAALAHRLMFGAAVIVLILAGAPGIGQTRNTSGFASRIAELSEPGGYFDTDNLISNEKSYLHVIPALRQAAVTGGAYIGVGPDQNFSYIARVRPAIAFIVDVRRDNLLLHLLFKALFSMAGTRAEYLSLLFGRAPPARPDEWRAATIDRLAAYVDGTQPAASTTVELDGRINATIATFGVPLSRDDLATIHQFHHRFIEAGLPLKFESKGRPSRSYYPTYRELLLETDRQGHHWNYLASEDDYQSLRSLQRRDLIIPVVGNLSGRSALAAIGRLMTARGDRLSAFYTSNVEFYLFGDGTFPRFVENLTHLPRTDRSMIIRSVFGGFTPIDAAPGYYSASIVQSVDDLVTGFSSGRYRTYHDLAR